jgi:hypothetical protein
LPRRLRGVTTSSRTLLGLLFPSWTFFDAVRQTPTLQVRRLPVDGSEGEWRAAVTPPSRRWWHVVFHPAGTQTLAAQTLVEMWCRELMEQEDASAAGGASLSLVMALAERAVAAMAGSVPRDGEGWQVRMVVTDEDDDRVRVLYESGRVAMPATRVAP